MGPSSLSASTSNSRKLGARWNSIDKPKKRDMNGQGCKSPLAMATLPATSSSFLPGTPITRTHNHQPYFHHNNPTLRSSQKRVVFKVQAAKLPAGVELPKEVPKFQPPFLGFTRTAETWNSRTCMIGIIGIFILELITNKGILQIIGVEVGKGLDLPL